jgi:hypothetical protein
MARARPILLPALVLAAVGASAAASASLAEPPASEIKAQLDAELDGMAEAGVRDGDPKRELLEEQRDELAAGRGAPARREPGVDTAGRLAEAEDVTEAQADAEADGVAPGARAEPQAAAAGGEDGALVEEGERARWDAGAVVCEPVPGMLTMAEVSGAVCVSVPQPDGTSRYVVVAPSGTVRSVRFATDGAVSRLPDATLGATAPRGTTAAATATGDLRVTVPGRAPTTLDLR